MEEESQEKEQTQLSINYALPTPDAVQRTGSEFEHNRRSTYVYNEPTIDEQAKTEVTEDGRILQYLYNEQTGEKTYFTRTDDINIIVASDVGDAGTVTTGDNTFDFTDGFNVQASSQVQFASKDKKAALLEGIHDAENLGELSVAWKAVTDSYQSNTDNIGQKGYEEALRVFEAKKLSLEAGASDEVQAGNATDVNGNAYSVHDSNSKGDGRTADVIDGNSNTDVETGSIRDDNVTPGARRGNGGIEDSDGSSFGNGNGTGYGDGNGSGDGPGTGVSSSQPATSKQQTTEHIDAGTALSDKSAAAAYAQSISFSDEINHIFHNDYYSEDPVPAWAFSVDFIPLCSDDVQFNKLFTLDDSRTLTKAVLKITANEKTINTQSINYLGMQHPFFTKLQQSHGDLQITFAEDETFTITNILKTVLKYASYLPNFPTNKVYEMKKGNWGYDVVAHTADDNYSPQYRLNATDMGVDDDKLSSLVHPNKFVFDIILKMYRAVNTHIFADDIAPPTFVYHFHKCWLKNIAGIELNYDNDKMIDRSVVFSYQYMSSAPYYMFKQRNNVETEKDAKEQLKETYEEAAKQATESLEGAIAEVDKANEQIYKNPNPNLQYMEDYTPPGSYQNTAPSVKEGLDELLKGWV